MQIKTSLCAALLAGISTGMSGCAVSHQDNLYRVGIDQRDLTSSSLQEFRIGQSTGVVRRNLQGQLQIKLADRLKVLDLGPDVDVASVVYPIRFAQYDVLVVSLPTSACPHAHRIYQLKGDEVGMWDINHLPGRCSASLGFSRDQAGLIARQLSERADRQVWMWSNGKLVAGLEQSVAVAPKPTPVSRPTPTAVPVSSSSNASGGTLSSARFESEDTSVTAEAAATGSNTAAARPHASAKRAASAVPAKGSPSAAKRIDAGNYEKLPAASQQEITPVKIILRDSN